MDRKAIGGIITFVLIVSVVSIYYLGDEQNGDNHGDPKILSIIQEPQNPSAGEKLSITIVVENVTYCRLQYESQQLYNESGHGSGSGGGGGSMDRRNKTTFVYTFNPFVNGTWVWYMVQANGFNSNYVLSDEYTFQIGDIEAGNQSTLAISNVSYSPTTPSRQDEEVIVTANISSNETLDEISFSVFFFFYDGTASSSSSGGWDPLENATYTQTFDLRRRLDDTLYPRETLIFFFIMATDDSGNSEISPTYTFKLN